MSQELHRLKKEMERSIDEYSAEVRFILEGKQDDESVTVAELEHLHKHTFYTFLEFKNTIVKHFKALESRQS